MHSDCKSIIFGFGRIGLEIRHRRDRLNHTLVKGALHPQLNQCLEGQYHEIRHEKADVWAVYSRLMTQARRRMDASSIQAL